MVKHSAHHTKKAALAEAARMRRKGLEAGVKVGVVGVTNAQTGRGLIYSVYTYR